MATDLSRVGREELLAMVAELETQNALQVELNAALTAQVTALQEDGTKRLEASLPRAVRAFHVKFGHPVRHTPCVPADEEVRFRLKLIGEEFLEFLEACLDKDAGHVGDMVLPKDFKQLHEQLAHVINHAVVKVNLVEAFDALVDMAYVVEGGHCIFGTSSVVGLAEVQRANMSKDPVYVRDKDAYHKHAGKEVGGGFEIGDVQRPDPTAKPTKPANWKAPDMRRILIDQGWEPTR